jgi:hypothetical protein
MLDPRQSSYEMNSCNESQARRSNGEALAGSQILDGSARNHSSELPGF